MKLQDQVITYDQALRLKELGVDQDSAFAFLTWTQDPVFRSGPGWIRMSDSIAAAAFTVAELGKMLPEWLRRSAGSLYALHQWHRQKLGDGGFDWWYLGYRYPERNEIVHEVRGSTEAQARAAMLIHLLENNLTTIEEVNARLKQ